MLADNQNERRRLLKKEKADTLKRLPRIEDTFRHEIDEQFNVFELANLPNINPPTVIVQDTASDIITQPAKMLIGSHFQPRNNTAKIEFNADSIEHDGEQIVTLAFFFRFENSSPNPMLVGNIASKLVIKGLWEAEASQAFLPLLHKSDIMVDVELDLIEFWKGQPQHRLYGEPTRIVELDTDGWNAFPNDSQDSAFEWVFNSYDVKHSSVVVPPKGLLVFEVALGTWGACFAGIHIKDGGSSVLCPFLQFEVTEVVQKGPPLP